MPSSLEQLCKETMLINSSLKSCLLNGDICLKIENFSKIITEINAFEVQIVQNQYLLQTLISEISPN